jgi:hypothetical protein
MLSSRGKDTKWQRGEEHAGPVHHSGQTGSQQLWAREVESVVSRASAKRSSSNKLQGRSPAVESNTDKAALSHSPRPSGRMQRGGMTPCGWWSGQRRFPVGEDCDEELRDHD